VFGIFNDPIFALDLSTFLTTLQIFCMFFSGSRGRRKDEPQHAAVRRLLSGDGRVRARAVADINIAAGVADLVAVTRDSPSNSGGLPGTHPAVERLVGRVKTWQKHPQTHRMCFAALRREGLFVCAL